MFLFVTSDTIGSGTGGGIVTKYEMEALNELGPTDIFNPPAQANPFDTELGQETIDVRKYKLAHFYAGTFPRLVERLRNAGVKVTYTAAAHDIKDSQDEFKSIGASYDYPHITNPDLFKLYLSSYLNADLIICPSKHSETVMRSYGSSNVRVIPHGCEPGRNIPYPKTFNVGYLGQIGPDKGVVYLIKAWAKLNYKDAILTIAGSQSPSLIHHIRAFGGNANYNVLGYVQTLDMFFSEIKLYVQPSVTEGFGIEVLESMAYGRPVIATTGVGASDCLNHHCRLIEKRDITALADAIDYYRNISYDYRNDLINHAQTYNWPYIKSLYKSTWTELLKS